MATFEKKKVTNGIVYHSTVIHIYQSVDIKKTTNGTVMSMNHFQN